MTARAQAALDAGRWQEAETLSRDALARDARDPHAHHLLGLALMQRGAAAEAVALFYAALHHAADPSVLNDLGGALQSLGLRAEAEARLRESLSLDPNAALTCYNLGCLLRERGDPEALAMLRRAVTLDPNSAHGWLGAGNAAFESGDYQEAERCYRAAIALRPEFAEALSNLGNALTEQLRLEEGIAAYRAALALRPDSANAGYACALSLLLCGDFAEGWQRYEARRGVAQLRWNYQRRPELPKWQPDMKLEGRRVLVMFEQGSGDAIQFARYVPLLAGFAAQVTLELPSALQPVFAALPGVARIIGLDDPAPECEIGCPLLSLPLVFGTQQHSIPAAVPYARAPALQVARWRAWLDGIPGRRIGLVCSGAAYHPHDSARSIPLADLAPILDAPGCSFVLLQAELRERDRAALAGFPNLHWPEGGLADFGDTAALLEGLDLLIAVDTAVAHLAGALARPAWVMLRHAPDFRWLLGRSDSPWYPTMRLFRQHQPHQWKPVIAAVRRALDDFR